MITTTNLSKIFKNTPYDILEEFVLPLQQTAARYDIDNSKRLAAFISQVGHESGGFKRIVENLNYSAERLMVVFPRYFKNRNPLDYHKQPEKIANLVYSNRMGNGDPSSGDGWKYRGRGLIQLTGKNNYQKYSASIKRSVDDTIKYLETTAGACMSAGWYWDINDLNKWADLEDIRTITFRINGGQIGIIERIELYLLAKKYLV
jgi:putative chitinase